MNFREKKYEKKRKSFGHSPAKFESRAVHFFGKKIVWVPCGFDDNVSIQI